MSLTYQIKRSKLDRSAASFLLLIVAIVLPWLPVQPCAARTPSSPAKSGASRAAMPGVVLKIVNEKFGLSKYCLSATTLRAESPMLLVFADSAKGMITVGTWETKKCFTFPMEKAKYYTELMGFNSSGQGGSDFRRDYKLSAWEKTRMVPIGDLTATEYKRHVINPPPGRSRTQYQLVVDSESLMSSKLLSIYNRLLDSDPAVRNGVVLGDRVVITNPSQGWTELDTKSAKKSTLTKEESSFPTGFQKVGSVSELFLSDSGQSAPNLPVTRSFIEKIRLDHKNAKQSQPALKP